MSCSSCKKAKVIKKLEPIILDEAWAPSEQEIKLAYAELTSLSGVKDDKKDFINKIYQFIFGESFEFDNKTVGFNQARRFKTYLGL